jgi:hypothetical protein
VTRSVIRIAEVAFLLDLADGLAIMLVGSLATGDWYALQLPWSEIGMWLITIGLGGATVFVTLEILVEPVGRWRWLAVPGVAVGAWFWFIVALVGLPAGGACCNQPTYDLHTTLYSAPQYIAILGAALATTGLPLLLARPWTRRAR